MTEAATLREQVDAKKGPDNGTVVTFDYVFDLESKPKHQKVYTYAAIWIADQNRWYLSGASRSAIGEVHEHDAFISIIARPNTKKAWVLNGKARFKP